MGDIGCGTGILSLFAAESGAAHVYAIDNSSIIEQAKQIAQDNGLADRITFIRGQVEQVTLPVDKVDVIISEWMGYFLFYEAMLDTVLFARDKWLNKGGVMLPDRCSISVCGIEDEDYKEDKINWWSNVWGFDMSCIRERAILEPLVDSVDVNNVTKEEINYKAAFRLKAERNDHIHALVAYFDCGLPIATSASISPRALTTSTPTGSRPF